MGMPGTEDGESRGDGAARTLPGGVTMVPTAVDQTMVALRLSDRDRMAIMRFLHARTGRAHPQVWVARGGRDDGDRPRARPGPREMDMWWGRGPGRALLRARALEALGLATLVPDEDGLRCDLGPLFALAARLGRDGLLECSPPRARARALATAPPGAVVRVLE